MSIFSPQPIYIGLIQGATTNEKLPYMYIHIYIYIYRVCRARSVVLGPLRLGSVGLGFANVGVGNVGFGLVGLGTVV